VTSGPILLFRSACGPISQEGRGQREEIREDEEGEYGSDECQSRRHSEGLHRQREGSDVWIESSVFDRLVDFVYGQPESTHQRMRVIYLRLSLFVVRTVISGSRIR